MESEQKRKGLSKRNGEETRLPKFCHEKKLCGNQMVSKKKQSNVTHNVGGIETETHFELIGKNNMKY